MSQPAQKNNEAVSSPPRPILEGEPVENRRVLVVDDEVAITDGYVSILGSKGNVVPMRRSSRSTAPAEAATTSPVPVAEIYEITVANTADQALQLVKQSIIEGKPFAMGFFDVVLGPGMDGIELVRKIHEIDNDLYAVFVTAYHDRGVDSINGLLGQAMADKWDYLNKPFSEGEIVQKARNAVSIWNLRRQKEYQDLKIAEANRRLHTNDRSSAVAAVSRGVGHEFGNILLQIIGRAELAKKGSPEDMKKALEMILKAGETATAILDRFKNLARSSEAKIQIEKIWANAPIEEALELLSHQFQRSAIRICKIKNDRVEILACHSSLVQVYVNLFINALHAMGSPGQIDISVKTDLPHGVEIRIRDYGPGIPAELQDKIMEPFFTTKGDQGTGLGLSICKEIIEIEHRGSLTVQNHPAKGAEFVVKLPLNPEG